MYGIFLTIWICIAVRKCFKYNPSLSAYFILLYRQQTWFCNTRSTMYIGWNCPKFFGIKLDILYKQNKHIACFSKVKKIVRRHIQFVLVLSWEETKKILSAVKMDGVTRLTEGWHSWADLGINKGSGRILNFSDDSSSEINSFISLG